MAKPNIFVKCNCNPEHIRVFKSHDIFGFYIRTLFLNFVLQFNPYPANVENMVSS